MIYLALAFCVIFTAFFVWETKKSLSAGVVRSRGSAWARTDRPVFFWLGIMAWLINVAAGTAFTIVIANIILNGSPS